ncbi:MAG: nucleotidyltransferase [Lachnospiraceae bacterium]|nr:nucleotidyltransferase [Lachnospiraceae bacterium]
MKKPVLVIMAAGMGSRYGGLKQIDPVDDQGHIIMDFSLFDAVKAGFEKVIFVIKKENEKDFKEVIGDRIAKVMQTEYAFQNIDDIPSPFTVPEGRVKPWGTAHAVLSCRELIDSPFVVINADDYYGRSAFAQLYDYLVSHEDGEKYQYAMVGYVLENTLTENGHVARGVCLTDENSHLAEITERTRIERKGDETAYTEDDGATWHVIPAGSIVSMNMWGFTSGFMKELEAGFAPFLEKGLQENPLKCEYFLPSVVDRLITEDKAEVTVLKSFDRWYGVTYKEDKQTVMDAIAKMKADGLYPQKLWNEN